MLRAADLAHNFQLAFEEVVIELWRNASELGLAHFPFAESAQASRKADSDHKREQPEHCWGPRQADNQCPDDERAPR